MSNVDVAILDHYEILNSYVFYYLNYIDFKKWDTFNFLIVVIIESVEKSLDLELT